MKLAGMQRVGLFGPAWLVFGCARLLGFEDAYVLEESDGSGGLPGQHTGGEGGASGGTDGSGGDDAGDGGSTGGSEPGTGGNAPGSGGVNDSGGSGGTGGVSSGSGGSASGGSNGGSTLRLEVLSAGSTHACGIRQGDGTLVCWGGLNSQTRQVPPGAYIDVAAGQETSCALDEDGFAHCWGWSASVQPPNVAFSSIAAYGEGACAIRSDNQQIECWGNVFMDLPAGAYEVVALGRYIGCALTPEGSALCGSPDGIPSGSGSYSRIAVGEDHVCARVSASGVIECWGSNFFDQATPLTGAFSEIAAGNGFTCGIRGNGTLACWGSTFGALSAIPSGQFGKISAGDDFVCVLDAEGAVTCWGNPSFGRTAPPLQ